MRVNQVRTGKEIVLATKPYARDSALRSWWHVSSTSLLLIAAVTATLWNIPLLAKIICSMLAGLLFLRLFVIYHDQQHRAILPHSTFADVLMRIFGILSLSPSTIWNSSHNYHHNHNSKLRT